MGQCAAKSARPKVATSGKLPRRSRSFNDVMGGREESAEDDLDAARQSSRVVRSKTVSLLQAWAPGLVFVCCF